MRVLAIGKRRRRSMFRAVALFLAVVGASASLAQAPGFRVDFSWEGTGACFDPKSPAFTVSGVPAGTTRLTFAMRDLDAPTYPHGGGTIAYTGQPEVARGAFAYRGPCPPAGQHTYEWTVEAQDGTGKTMATATVAKKFPPR